VRERGRKSTLSGSRWGDVDAFVIVDVPDEASLLALELAVNATGGHVEEREADPPEDVDHATRKPSRTGRRAANAGGRQRERRSRELVAGSA